MKITQSIFHIFPVLRRKFAFLKAKFPKVHIELANILKTFNAPQFTSPFFWIYRIYISIILLPNRKWSFWLFYVTAWSSLWQESHYPVLNIYPFILQGPWSKLGNQQGPNNECSVLQRNDFNSALSAKHFDLLWKL